MRFRPALTLLLVLAGCSSNSAEPEWRRLGGADAPIRALTPFQGRLVFGGEFSTVDAFGPDEQVHALAAWSPEPPAADDTTWTSLPHVADGAGTWYDINPEPNGSLYALAVFRGELIVAGAFTYIGPTPAAGVARWNGRRWSALGEGVSGIVYSLAVVGDSLLFAGGSFESAGGAPAAHLAQWDGSRWQPLGAGTNGTVHALRVAGGALFAGGGFDEAGGASARHIARWNGATWDPLDTGTDGAVLALATFRGALIAGGEFLTANSLPMNHLARWNGISWQPLAEGLAGFDLVAGLAVEGERLYATGGVIGGAGGIEAWDTKAWMTTLSGSLLTGGAIEPFDGALIAATEEGGTASLYQRRE